MEPFSAVVDAKGMPVQFGLTPGEAHGYRRAITGHIGRNAVYPASARLHQFTGDFFSLSCFTKKSVPSLKSLRGAPDQYAVLHVAVLQLPPP